MTFVAIIKDDESGQKERFVKGSFDYAGFIYSLNHYASSNYYYWSIVKTWTLNNN